VSQFCIYGAGRHAEDLLAPLIFDRGRDAVLCLVDDFDPDRNEAGFDVVNFDAACLRHPKADWLIAVGEPAERMRTASMIEDRSGEEGFFISSRRTISHESWIGNFVSISPWCTAAAVPARPLGRAEC
jgi:hypothetical protein